MNFLCCALAAPLDACSCVGLVLLDAVARGGKNAVTNALDILNGFYNPTFVQLKQAPAAEGYERFSAANAGSDGKTVRRGRRRTQLGTPAQKASTREKA